MQRTERYKSIVAFLNLCTFFNYFQRKQQPNMAIKLTCSASHSHNVLGNTLKQGKKGAKTLKQSNFNVISHM